MVQIALLLIGMKAVQRRWQWLAAVGAIWASLGLVVVVSPFGGMNGLTLHALGAFLVLEGLVAMIAGLTTGATGWMWIARALILIVFGGLVIETPWRNFLLISVLFGTALVADGALRLTSTLLVRFPGWRFAVAANVLEFILAALALTPWPLPYEATVPFCLGIALLLSGWTVLRSAFLLRRLPPDAPVTSLPIFEQRRGWLIPPMLPGPWPDDDADSEADHAAEPHMTVHVWTALASSIDPVRRPVLDRYVAAVDRHGTIATGHAALEATPNLYISHYRAAEQDRSHREFRDALNAGTHNDVPGRFLPSYREEADDWCDATEHVVFRHFDAERLRSFWAHYRQDTTYNLTNRNCSVVVALALDVALEGVLAEDLAWWPPILRLLAHPDLYLATLLRKRAATMTWTPGLVLDYARALHRVVEPPRLSWVDMAWQSVGAYRKTRRRQLQGATRRSSAVAVVRSAK